MTARQPQPAWPSQPASPTINDVLRTYWGFDTLRPLQQEAITAEIEGRDSLVVMPTGGGKSLCYQVPPLLTERTDVVVSPLISLMKDQVDGLRAMGYPAAGLHSGLSQEESAETARAIRQRACRLIFASPERLLTPRFIDLMRSARVRSFAIDEAHCISHWGHDFRQEYRRLASLRDHFPQAAIHAYTATATPRVRDDIIAQLGLHEPEVLVGRFDRPNLTYRVIRRLDPHDQVADVIARHGDGAVIIYCMTRRDTEVMANALRARKINALEYHAGLAADVRRRVQDAFAAETVNVVAATVAFGMGIDRSNVRGVIHATMPKSIEHYQQETGRAGRDGLDAECVLLYSAADVQKWESLIVRGTQEAENVEEAERAVKNHVALLGEMRRFAVVPRCRHAALSEYFGQTLDSDNCDACDVCFGEVEGGADHTITAQKILSCVARMRIPYGVTYLVDVLQGSDTEPVRRRGHDRLSCYGLLDGVPAKTLQNYVFQLVDQGILDRTVGDRPVLHLNDASWRVMRGEREVLLIEPKESRQPVRRSRRERESWEGVDRALFERLRTVRRELAKQLGKPAYVVFPDTTLREMARHKPTDVVEMLAIPGVGQAKMQRFGDIFLEAIAAHERRDRVEDN